MVYKERREAAKTGRRERENYEIFACFLLWSRGVGLFFFTSSSNGQAGREVGILDFLFLFLSQFTVIINTAQMIYEVDMGTSLSSSAWCCGGHE